MPKRYLEQYLEDNYSLPSITKDLESQDTDIIVAFQPRHTAQPGQEQIFGFAQLTRGTSEPCLASKSQFNFCQLQRLYVISTSRGRAWEVR